MEKNQTTLPSGRTLVVNVAPFATANKLRKVLLAELRQVDVNLGDNIGKLLSLDISEMSGTALNSIKNVVCQLLASDVVEQSVFECLGRCTIDGGAVKRETAFEPIETRGDYLPAAWEVVKANASPFFAGIDLSSLTARKAGTDAPP
jgi:hypothetical protein